MKFKNDAKRLALTQERLKEILHYDPDTGIFTWKVSRGSIVAGRITSNKVKHYIRIQIDGVLYLNHRLAWFYTYGYWPKQLDHINRDKLDNRICNLREVTHQQNEWNKPFGINHGVYLRHGRNPKYLAAISHNSKNIYLGSFLTIEEARKVVKEKVIELRGEFACFN